MKKILLIFFCLTSKILIAQNQYLNNNPVWLVSNMCCDECPTLGCEEITKTNYYINGDSIINNHLYKILRQKSEITHQVSGPAGNPISCTGVSYYNDSTYIVAFVRDSLHKMYFNNGISDTLLYDFNLSVGDTLPVTLVNYYYGIIVTSIDSIIVGTSYRKKFNLQNSSAQYLIEGIGHRMGFLEPMQVGFDCASDLDCFGLGDSAYYPALGTTCVYDVGIKENTSDINKINIYPNPVSQTIHLQNQKLKTLSIKDITGREVMYFTHPNTTIDVSTLNKGIYFIEGYDGDKKVDAKFVKE